MLPWHVLDWLLRSEALDTAIAASRTADMRALIAAIDSVTGAMMGVGVPSYNPRRDGPLQ